jgi:putative CocE/NonD family hydrolase
MTGGAFDYASGLGWFRGAGMKVFYRPPQGTTDEEFQRLVDYYDPAPKLPPLDFQQAFWTLPVIDAIGAGVPTDWEDFLSHPPADPYWRSLNYIWDDDRFDVPALHVSSWYDGAVNEALILFNLFRTNAVSPRGRDHQYVIISPTDHCRSEVTTADTVIGERAMGDTRLDYFRIYLEWFEHWLRGADNDILDMPRVQYYLMGANEWRSAPGWPLPGTEYTKYYLHSGGDANSRHGDGRLDPTPPKTESADHYTYDPGSPVPTVGGPICCISADAAAAGSYDQSEVEMRGDVLVYTSAPLAEGLEVTGPIESVLYVSSSARDTDFTAKLVDVYPDGRAFNVQEGILRARYREGYEKSVLMEPGGVYEVRISLHATANYFGPGHRIRFEVSSSNFPRFERNLNTGGSNYDETDWVVAQNIVHHTAQYSSHVVLPIVSKQE